MALDCIVKMAQMSKQQSQLQLAVAMSVKVHPDICVAHTVAKSRSILLMKIRIMIPSLTVGSG